MKKETKLLVENKISSLLELLRKLKEILEEHKKNLRLQEYLLFAAEKKAEEIVELAISINQELLKEKEKISLSYYDSFMDLMILPIFKKEELKDLASTAGFRNRLAHEYLELDEKIALKAMEKILKIYPDYLQKIRKIISG